jgi:hypothetical protein
MDDLIKANTSIYGGYTSEELLHEYVQRFGKVPAGITETDMIMNLIASDDAEVKSVVEFGIVNEKCPFCDQKTVVNFNEHYYFCPACTAIYTFLMILEKECDHINHDTPCVDRKPIHGTETVYIYTIDGGIWDGQQVCSECGAHCIADGW